MKNFKINHRIGLFLALLLFVSCNKEAKVKMGGEIHAIMPHTNTPIAGIKWKVVETKSGGLYSNAKNTGWILEGETDANGYALVEFFPKKSVDYSYTINFDYSQMNLSAGDYKIVGGPPEYAIMERGYQTIQNTYNIRVLPFLNISFNWKNENCFDTNDFFKYKIINFDETPNDNIELYSWIESSALFGCTDIIGVSNKRLAGRYIVKWEAIRGGNSTNDTDTFLVQSNNQMVNVFW